MVNAPEAVLISDPVADLETVVNAFADAEELAAGVRTRRRPGWLSRQRGRGGQVSMRASGLLVYEGRRCCMTHLLGLNGILGRLRLPYATECPTCHATFSIEQRVRSVHG